MINSLEIVSCRFHYSVVIFVICLFILCPCEFTHTKCCIHCLYQLCGRQTGNFFFHFFRDEFRRDEQLFFYPSNICIKLSLRVTFALHIISWIDSTLHCCLNLKGESWPRYKSIRWRNLQSSWAPSIICLTNICLVSVNAHATLQTLHHSYVINGARIWWMAMVTTTQSLFSKLRSMFHSNKALGSKNFM